MSGPDNPRPKKAKPDPILDPGAGGMQRWSDKEMDLEPIVPKPSIEIALPPQNDAPHVFRFTCPGCLNHLSLYGRMGNWFIKTLGI